MRILRILAIAVVTFGGLPVLISAASAADEAAVRAAVKRVLDTFNAHDSEANSALDDEVYESWDGTVKGAAEDMKSTKEFFAQAKDVQRKMTDEIGIVFVTPDVAIYKFRAHWTGFVDGDGKSYPPADAIHAMVMVKRADGWRLAAGFNRM